MGNKKKKQKESKKEEKVKEIGKRKAFNRVKNLEGLRNWKNNREMKMRKKR